MTEKYQGWANYPTWNVALWIDNEQYTHEHVQARARELCEECDTKDEAESGMREWLEENYGPEGQFCDRDGGMPEGPNGDILTWAYELVDWDELAEHYISDLWTDKEFEGDDELDEFEDLSEGDDAEEEYDRDERLYQ